MGFFSEGNKSKGKDSSGIVWTNTIAPQSKEHTQEILNYLDFRKNSGYSIGPMVTITWESQQNFLKELYFVWESAGM